MAMSRSHENLENMRGEDTLDKLPSEVGISARDQLMIGIVQQRPVQMIFYSK